MTKRAQFIPPDAYPQPMNKSEVACVARVLRSPQMTERGTRVIAEQSQSLHVAVCDLVDDLEKAGREQKLILQASHEIRGLAATAGMAAAGRIADGLCRYCDEVDRLGLGPDPAIISLHVIAILRATRKESERGAVSEEVARELAALVSHKLTEIKTLLA